MTKLKFYYLRYQHLNCLQQSHHLIKRKETHTNREPHQRELIQAQPLQSLVSDLSPILVALKDFVFTTENIWARSQSCRCLVTWFCYQLIAKPGNKTATALWPDPYIVNKITCAKMQLVFYSFNILIWWKSFTVIIFSSISHLNNFSQIVFEELWVNGLKLQAGWLKSLSQLHKTNQI